MPKRSRKFRQEKIRRQDIQEDEFWNLLSSLRLEMQCPEMRPENKRKLFQALESRLAKQRA